MSFEFRYDTAWFDAISLYLLSCAADYLAQVCVSVWVVTLHSTIWLCTIRWRKKEEKKERHFIWLLAVAACRVIEILSDCPCPCLCSVPERIWVPWTPILHLTIWVPWWSENITCMPVIHNIQFNSIQFIFLYFSVPQLRLRTVDSSPTPARIPIQISV